MDWLSECILMDSGQEDAQTISILLRKAGVDTMTIKDLGRWESLEMVQRYTRSISFQDSMKFYKAPLG